MIPALLGALKFAPAVLSAGREIVGALTGRSPAPDATPEAVAAEIESLPHDQRMAATMQVMAAKARMQDLDTERFVAMTGSAEELRASARPRIALAAMGVVTLFARGAAVLFGIVVLDWGVRVVCGALGVHLVGVPTVGDLLAALEPVTELIWAPLIASFWAAVEVVKKYMGCRERDKARADELTAGRPLESAQATVVDAGGAVAGIIRALKGRP